MSRYSRIEVFLTMQSTGLVPVLYHPDIEICKNVVKACYDGGARVFEFTNRGDFAHEVFSELNKYVLKELPGMMLGVGSVVDPGTTSLYIQLGAAFIVSPVIVEEMAVTCNRRKILWTPGCGTLTEISRAESLGAELVKIFPAAEVGGPSFVKAVKAPCPWTNIMPTGGVSPDRNNLEAWFSAGVTCVGMGSKLITSTDVKSENWSGIKEKVRDTLQTIREIRNQIAAKEKG